MPRKKCDSCGKFVRELFVVEEGSDIVDPFPSAPDLGNGEEEVRVGECCLDSFEEELASSDEDESDGVFDSFIEL